MDVLISNPLTYIVGASLILLFGLALRDIVLIIINLWKELIK